jgi:predicted membrane protein
MKFVGKWIELENIFLNEVTQSQKSSHNMYSLTSTPELLSLAAYAFLFLVLGHASCTQYVLGLCFLLHSALGDMKTICI